MRVQIPSVAFAALADSAYPGQYPDMWERVTRSSWPEKQGRGYTVHVEASEEDIRTLRACMLLMVQKLNEMPYPQRGVEGDVTMRSLQVSMSRIDDALTGGLARRSAVG